MILYPAIDLKDGQCVRLVRGDMASATVFNDSPAKQAKAFWDDGCRWLHVVDLDGAFEGFSVNGQAIDAILEACPNMRIQLGGGIRGMAKIEHWINKHISRVILGTVAAEDPDLVREAAAKFPNQIAVGIDAFQNGMVATRGWAKDSGIYAPELAKYYQDSGVSAIIYTEIARDGAMKGPNIIRTAAIARKVTIPVIASGGVSSLDDLKALKTCGTRLNGVISGRALYDKKIDIKDALALLNE